MISEMNSTRTTNHESKEDFIYHTFTYNNIQPEQLQNVI